MSKNITNAVKALDVELDAGRVDQEDMTAYLEGLDAVVAKVRAIKDLYRGELRVQATRRSRAKKAAEIAEMKARLAQFEDASK